MTTHELFLSLLPSVTNALILHQNEETGYYTTDYLDPFGNVVAYREASYTFDKSTGLPVERIDFNNHDYIRLKSGIDYKTFPHSTHLTWQQKLSSDAITLAQQLTTDATTHLRKLPNLSIC